MRRRKLNKSPVLGFCGFVIGYECKEKGIKLMECDKAQADAIIVPHHFSHKVTKNSCLNLLVLYKDKIRGAMQIGHGIRPHIKTHRRRQTASPSRYHEDDLAVARSGRSVALANPVAMGSVYSTVSHPTSSLAGHLCPACAGPRWPHC